MKTGENRNGRRGKMAAMHSSSANLPVSEELFITRVLDAPREAGWTAFPDRSVGGETPCAVGEVYGGLISRQEIVPECGDNQLDDPNPPAPLPAHRTNTGSRIRQTATRISDESRYRRLAGRIIVCVIREWVRRNTDMQRTKPGRKTRISSVAARGSNVLPTTTTLNEGGFYVPDMWM